MNTTRSPRFEALIRQLAERFDDADLADTVGELCTPAMLELVRAGRHEEIGRQVCAAYMARLERMAQRAQAREQIEYFNGADSMWCPLHK